MIELIYVLCATALIVFVGIAAFSTARTLNNAYWRWRQKRDPRWIALTTQLAKQRAQAKSRSQARQRQWATLQTALVQLDRCDDYRRAANIAGHLSHLPARHRQQLFARQRPHLVRHFAKRLEAGESERLLLTSLAQLLTALGVATFEAEYIARDARRLSPNAACKRAGDPALRGRLDHLAIEHRQRLAAIAATQGLDPALRENLRQSEIARYQRELFALTGADAPDPERYLREQLSQRQAAPSPDPDAISPLADIEAAIRHAGEAGIPVYRRPARVSPGDQAR
jgi:hypothetical protein